MIDTELLIGLMRSIWSCLEYDFEHEQYFEIVKRLREYDKMKKTILNHSGGIKFHVEDDGSYELKYKKTKIIPKKKKEIT